MNIDERHPRRCGNKKKRKKKIKREKTRAAFAVFKELFTSHSRFSSLYDDEVILSEMKEIRAARVFDFYLLAYIPRRYYR